MARDLWICVRQNVGVPGIVALVWKRTTLLNASCPSSSGSSHARLDAAVRRSSAAMNTLPCGSQQPVRGAQLVHHQHVQYVLLGVNGVNSCCMRSLR